MFLKKTGLRTEGVLTIQLIFHKEYISNDVLIKNRNVLIKNCEWAGCTCVYLYFVCVCCGIFISQYKDKRHSTFTGGCGVVRGFGELILEMFAWFRNARWH